MCSLRSLGCPSHICTQDCVCVCYTVPRDLAIDHPRAIRARRSPPARLTACAFPHGSSFKDSPFITLSCGDGPPISVSTCPYTRQCLRDNSLTRHTSGRYASAALLHPLEGRCGTSTTIYCRRAHFNDAPNCRSSVFTIC